LREQRRHLQRALRSTIKKSAPKSIEEKKKMSANEWLKKLPAVFKGENDGTSNVFQFNISEPCYFKIENGSCAVFDGQADKPDLTLVATDENLVKLLKGQLNGMMAVATGKVKIQGNMMLATKISTLFDLSALS
jgi:putative sterol carrier protein